MINCVVRKRKKLRTLDKEIQRIVIKVGTTTITNEDGSPKLSVLEDLSKSISILVDMRKEVVLVSSGAVSLGRYMASKLCKVNGRVSKKALSSIGQSKLMSLYDESFSKYGKITSQLLLINENLLNNQEKIILNATIKDLLEMKVVPIINENDSISNDKNSLYNNDNLAGLVSEAIGADMVIILSDIDGLYNMNPRKNCNAKLISIVPQITRIIEDAADSEGDERGSGGMKAKVEAAKYTTCKGIDLVITNGERPAEILDIVNGGNIGTCFFSTLRRGDCYECTS